jgi:hypothetical protein
MIRIVDTMSRTPQIVAARQVLVAPPIISYHHSLACDEFSLKTLVSMDWHIHSIAWYPHAAGEMAACAELAGYGEISFARMIGTRCDVGRLGCLATCRPWDHGRARVTWSSRAFVAGSPARKAGCCARTNEE